MNVDEKSNCTQSHIDLVGGMCSTDGLLVVCV